LNDSLKITYVGTDNRNTSIIEFDELITSLDGFNKAIKKIHAISKINGDISIEAADVRSGSIVFELLLHVQLTGQPFLDPRHAIDFLRLCSEGLAQIAQDALTVDGNLNRFYSEQGFNATALTSLVPLFIQRAIKAAGKMKRNLNATTDDGRPIPTRYVGPFRRMVDRGEFKKALKPIVDDTVTRIEVGDGDLKTVLDQTSFQEYLGEGDQVLPQLVNGQEVTLTATVTGMQSTRSDSLTLKLHDHGGLSVVAFPADGKTTKDYIDFYGQRVLVTAKIYRRSDYQKPKLILKELQIEQTEIFE